MRRHDLTTHLRLNASLFNHFDTQTWLADRNLKLWFWKSRMVLKDGNSIGNTKKSEKCFNLSSFCDGGLVGFWVGFQRLFWVQLSALDGVAVNPILFLLLFRPYNGILSFKNRHIFFIFWPLAPPTPKKSDGLMVYCLLLCELILVVNCKMTTDIST